MSNPLVLTPDLLEEAKSFKSEFLFRTFGATAFAAGTSQLSTIPSNSNEIFILSNNHVLADSNQGQIADNIIEPGVIDGGTQPIAKLTDFEPINLNNAPNVIDAAIAKVINNADVKSSILTIGNVQQPLMTPALYQSVRKHGRTTGHTVGMIMDIAADVNVRFGQKIANFEDQLAIQGFNNSLFSQGGDSGSLIVDATTRRPVGLLFAGGGNQTFACPIDKVLSRFNIDIL